MFRSRGKWLLATTVVASVLFAGEARAAFLVQVTASLNSPVPSATTVGGTTVTLTPVNDSSGDADLGTVARPIHLTYGSTSVTSTNAATSDAYSLDYLWTLTFAHLVNGVATGATASLAVSGTIDGVVSAFGSTLQNTFTGGPAMADALLTVDGQQLTIRLDPYTPPGTPPGTKNNFSVALSNQGPTSPSGQPVPEPTTFALMGVGGLLLLAPYLRRKTRVTASVS
jgi:hypothetical protein